jgi:multidrug transporter EmrE-like cation transporter
MLILGSLLALGSGMLNATAAALEKQEGMRTATRHQGMALLAALARRPLWLLAMALSACAWVGEAASLALAPVPVVATLRNAGRGLLVVSGGRWLNERFSRLELMGVGLASAGGVITAVGAASSKVSLKPLSNVAELIVGAACVLGAAGVVRCASSFLSAGAGRNSPQRTKTAGVATGAAVGLLFAGTGVFTKEIGDRFALYGAGGLPAALASLSPWLMVAMAVWAQSLLQQAFRRANAASVSAINASVASLGLIAAGFALYGENLPHGVNGVLLLGGMVVALAGTVLLLAFRPGAPEPAGGPALSAAAGGDDRAT